jgi:hypothetical protein
VVLQPLHKIRRIGWLHTFFALQMLDLAEPKLRLFACRLAS